MDITIAHSTQHYVLRVIYNILLSTVKSYKIKTKFLNNSTDIYNYCDTVNSTLPRYAEIWKSIDFQKSHAPPFLLKFMNLKIDNGYRITGRLLIFHYFPAL